MLVLDLVVSLIFSTVDCLINKVMGMKSSFIESFIFFFLGFGAFLFIFWLFS